MSDKEVDKLKKDLQDCKDEKGEMDDLLNLIKDQLTKTQEQFIILRLYRIQCIPTITEKTGEYLNMKIMNFKSGRTNEKCVRGAKKSARKGY